ncbi:MAG: hypothetical protein WCT27_03530 [Patescibacteria group bacterium]
MSTLLITLAVIAVLALIHYVQTCNPDIERKNIADHLRRHKEKNPNQKGKEIADSINAGLDSIMPSYEYHDTVVAKLIIGLFNLALTPLRLITMGFVWLICFLLQVIADAKATISANFSEKNGNRPGDLAKGLMLAFIVMIILAVLTVANFEILKIGLPAIMAADKAPIHILGMNIYAINVLAIVIIMGGFIMSLLAHEFRSNTSHFVEKSSFKSLLMLFGLLALCGVEAIIAVKRTEYVGDANILNTLPNFAVGFISFIVPFIAAICFEYMSAYLPWMLDVMTLIVVGILWLPFLLADVIVSLLMVLALMLLALVSSLFRMGGDSVKSMIKKSGQVKPPNANLAVTAPLPTEGRL